MDTSADRSFLSSSPSSCLRGLQWVCSVHASVCLTMKIPIVYCAFICKYWCLPFPQCSIYSGSLIHSYISLSCGSREFDLSIFFLSWLVRYIFFGMHGWGVVWCWCGDLFSLQTQEPVPFQINAKSQTATPSSKPLLLSLGDLQPLDPMPSLVLLGCVRNPHSFTTKFNK